jgi:hypothetical protein
MFGRVLSSKFLIATNILAASGVLWYGVRVSLDNRHILVENRLLRSAAQKPYVIRNLEVSLLPYLRPIGPPDAPPRPAKRLVLFGKDGCRFCAEQFPWWKRLVSTASERGLVSEVWLVSMNEGREFETLAHDFTQMGVPLRRYSVVSSAAFTAASGITGVPATVAISDDDRVTLAFTGILNEELLEGAVQAISEPSGSARFFPRTQLEPIRSYVSASR